MDITTLYNIVKEFPNSYRMESNIEYLRGLKNKTTLERLNFVIEAMRVAAGCGFTIAFNTQLLAPQENEINQIISDMISYKNSKTIVGSNAFRLALFYLQDVDLEKINEYNLNLFLRDTTNDISVILSENNLFDLIGTSGKIYVYKGIQNLIQEKTEVAEDIVGIMAIGNDIGQFYLSKYMQGYKGLKNARNYLIQVIMYCYYASKGQAEESINCETTIKKFIPELDKLSEKRKEEEIAKQKELEETLKQLEE